MGSIGIRWYDEERNIVIQEYSGAWNWEELYEAMLASFELIRPSGRNAALIVDMSHAKAPRPGSNTRVFAQFQKLRAVFPTNLGLVVAVGVEEYLRIIVETFQKATTKFSVRVEFVDTLQEVEPVLQKYHHQP